MPKVALSSKTPVSWSLLSLAFQASPRPMSVHEPPARRAQTKRLFFVVAPLCTLAT